MSPERKTRSELEAPERYRQVIDYELCKRCKKCVNECSFRALEFVDGRVEPVGGCVACGRCINVCPADAIEIRMLPSQFPPHANFNERVRRAIMSQASTGGVLLTSCGTDVSHPVVFDEMLLDAAQVTNPAIDPLREPVETATFVGKRPGAIEVHEDGDRFRMGDDPGPMIAMDMPIMIGHISLGSVSYNAQKALFMAANELNILAGSGEGGLHKDFLPFAKNIVSEVASGRFGVTGEYLKRTAAVEIKIGQGAKPGHGGHLPGEKVSALISQTRMIPMGTDALSPYPHHDIYSIEDLQQLLSVVKESTEYKVPVGVKIAAVHNIGAIASGAVRAGADFITIDGFRGGTGSTPRIIRDHVGLPIEVAVSVVDQRLTKEGLRNKVTVFAGGSIRSSADMIKAIALGADSVMICTAALVAMGCRVCQQCHRGICSWGIATQREELVARLDPAIASARVVRLLRSWNEELKEVMGAMGIDSVEALVGNRDRLRYFGPNPRIAEIMGVKHVGEGWG
ncbi:MAG TPA: glutamate synthase-related protein [Methanomassiliicoccales archaeon]|nr:glutamate synthase-related protein [Methanomassiliicoccales archaeon]